LNAVERAREDERREARKGGLKRREGRRNEVSFVFFHLLASGLVPRSNIHALATLLVSDP